LAEEVNHSKVDQEFIRDYEDAPDVWSYLALIIDGRQECVEANLLIGEEAVIDLHHVPVDDGHIYIVYFDLASGINSSHWSYSYLFSIEQFYFRLPNVSNLVCSSSYSLGKRLSSPQYCSNWRAYTPNYTFSTAKKAIMTLFSPSKLADRLGSNAFDPVY